MIDPKRQIAARAPSLATALSVFSTLRRQQRAFSAAGREKRPVEELLVQTGDGRLLEIEGHRLLDLRIAADSVVASQKYDELMRFLYRVRELEPRRICEIGTSAGGTLFALTRVAADDAIVVSVDIAIPITTRSLRARFARNQQRVISIEANSHEPTTKAEVERALANEPLDVLFIDGDHSYEGVSADFELYSGLVRAGGIIGLHDINEDFSARHGKETASISGDVPRFWTELKAKHKTEELIAEAGQDGYGIGIVYC